MILEDDPVLALLAAPAAPARETPKQAAREIALRLEHLARTFGRRMDSVQSDCQQAGRRESGCTSPNGRATRGGIGVVEAK